MLVIGERINTSRTLRGERIIEKAVEMQDTDFIKNLAANQTLCGADYIDINAGTLVNKEPQALAWLTKTVNASTNLPISFDSPSADALIAALEIYDFSKGQPFINSITLENERYNSILPLALKYNAKIVALAVQENSIDDSPDARCDAASQIIEKLCNDGIEINNIYLDPLIFPISTGDSAAISTLEIIKNVHKAYPKVHIIAGLSNISHGLPARKLINRAMLVMSMQNGLDAVIADPNDKELMALIATTKMLLGKDEYCMNYISLSREGKFDNI